MTQVTVPVSRDLRPRDDLSIYAADRDGLSILDLRKCIVAVYYRRYSIFARYDGCMTEYSAVFRNNSGQYRKFRSPSGIGKFRNKDIALLQAVDLCEIFNDSCDTGDGSVICTESLDARSVLYLLSRGYRCSYLVFAYVISVGVVV